MAMQVKRFVGRRTRWIVFGLLVALGVYLLAITPVRTYLDQREQMAVAQDRYELLAETNESLRMRAEQLQSDAEIERLAREHYELVRPGQNAYAVMPPPAPPAPPPDDEEDGLWDKITFWD